MLNELIRWAIVILTDVKEETRKLKSREKSRGVFELNFSKKWKKFFQKRILYRLVRCS